MSLPLETPTPEHALHFFLFFPKCIHIRIRYLVARFFHPTHGSSFYCFFRTLLQTIQYMHIILSWQQAPAWTSPFRKLYEYQPYYFTCTNLISCQQHLLFLLETNFWGPPPTIMMLSYASRSNCHCVLLTYQGKLQCQIQRNVTGILASKCYTRAALHRFHQQRLQFYKMQCLFLVGSTFWLYCSQGHIMWTARCDYVTKLHPIDTHG